MESDSKSSTPETQTLFWIGWLSKLLDLSIQPNSIIVGSQVNPNLLYSYRWLIKYEVETGQR